MTAQVAPDLWPPTRRPPYAAGGSLRLHVGVRRGSVRGPLAGGCRTAPTASKGSAATHSCHAGLINTLPMHQRHTQVEGPIQEYKRATGDWTPEMQQTLSQALATAKRRGPIILSMSYDCPECGESPTGITADSVLFYEDDDKDHMLNPVAEGRLIVMEGCGHSFRQELRSVGVPRS